ncbi:MAG: hypothetical protein J2P41_12630, partial [Blastocatellia bacterium]|nr:hypothetical protein [Blastocatellia bacterium]
MGVGGNLNYRLTTRLSASRLAVGLVISFLSIGLLFSQMCNIVCLYADRSDSTSVYSPKQGNYTSHCHRNKEAPPESPKDDGHNHSPHCPKHNELVSLQPDSQLTTDLIQQNIIQSFEAGLFLFGDSPAQTTAEAGD